MLGIVLQVFTKNFRQLFQQNSLKDSSFGSFLILVLSVLGHWHVASAQGVTFSPAPTAPIGVTQFRAQFDEQMVPTDNAFEVKCSPNIQGQGNWVSNGTQWAFDFILPEQAWGLEPSLPGGTQCTVKQLVDLKSTKGKTFEAAQVKPYTFTVSGPSVRAALVAPGFQGELREKQPVMFIAFDGDIDPSSLTDKATSFLAYASTAASPAEKLLLKSVPPNKVEEIYSIFNNEHWLEQYGVKEDSKNWAIVTVERDLIPGREVILSVSQVKSAHSSASVKEPSQFPLAVRSDFRAEVTCYRLDESQAFCQPEGGLGLQLNAKLSWKYAKDVYLEYIPRIDGQPSAQKVYANGQSALRNWLGWISESVGLSEATQVDRIDFGDLRIMPDTKARIVFPEGTVDIDGRALKSSLQTEVQFGSMNETLWMANGQPVFERKLIGNDGFPLSATNLGQKIYLRKPVDSQKNWKPLTDMTEIIRYKNSYEAQSYLGEGDEFVSPIPAKDLDSQAKPLVMSGPRNKRSQVKIAYPKDNNGYALSGAYVLEVLSELNDSKIPTSTVTLVTDLAIHLKRGQAETLAWVTSYSTGLTVGQASMEVYDCRGEFIFKGESDSNGLFKIRNEVALNGCESREFYVVARKDSDFSFVGSLEYTDSSWAQYAPNVEYFEPRLVDGRPYYHAVVGVNLVKPGQVVPIQILAQMPTETGLKMVETSQLPKVGYIQNINNTNIEFSFPLTWKDGTAQLEWNLSQTLQLGAYQFGFKDQEGWLTPVGEPIEVSEFKVPVMSGSLAISDLNASGQVRYANGVGAKDLPIQLSYYFSTSSFEAPPQYEGFNFANGSYNSDRSEQVDLLGLPTQQNMTLHESLVTDSEGSLSYSIGSDVLPNGQSVQQTVQKLGRPLQLVVRFKYQDQIGEYQTLSKGQQILTNQTLVGSSVVPGKAGLAKLNSVLVDVKSGLSLPVGDRVEYSVQQIKTTVMGEELFGGIVKQVMTEELVATPWTAKCLSDLKSGVNSCEVGSLKPGRYVFNAVDKVTAQASFSLFQIEQDGSIEGWIPNQIEGTAFAVYQDKVDYVGNETAKLKFNSPFLKCTALVTLERGDVVNTQVDTKACQNGFVTVSLKDEYAPNIFASVYLVSPRVESQAQQGDLGKPTFRQGFQNLKVNWKSNQLDVGVALNKAKYAPGETAVVDLSVKGADGTNLDQGYVTLVAIEESILKLKENLSYEVLNAMMGLRGHSVVTSNKYALIQASVAKQVEGGDTYDEPEVAAGIAKGEPGGGGGELSSGRMVFDSLVAWQTDVLIVDGKAQTTFKLNDKLTKFKVFAIARGSKGRFGMGQAAYLAEQDFQSIANIPLVARTGDKYPLIVNVQNNVATKPVTVLVDVVFKDAQGNVIGQKSLQATRTVDAGKAEGIRVGDVQIPKFVTSVEYAVKVIDDQGSVLDRFFVEPQAVVPDVPMVVQSSFLGQTKNGTLKTTVIKALGAEVGRGNLKVTLSKSLTVPVIEDIRSELALSKSDLMIEARMLRALLDSTQSKPMALEKFLLDLQSMVDERGFVKYSARSSQGDFWLTTELLQILSQEPWAVDSVPESLKKLWVASLRQVIALEIESDLLGRNLSEADVMLARIKASNALASLGDSEQLVALAEEVEQFKDLNKQSTEFLVEAALLVTRIGGTDSKTSKVLALTDTQMVIKGNAAVIDGRVGFSASGYSDEVIQTAKYLKAVSQLPKPVTSQTSQLLVQGLIEAQRSTGWYNLRSKAWVVTALKAFSRTYDEVQLAGQATVVNERTSAEQVVVDWKSVASQVTNWQWSADDALISVQQVGAGEPWVSVVAESAVAISTPRYQGISITKEVVNKTRPGSLDFKVGDLLEVTLIVSSSVQLNHVSLFDPIPAGANILSEGWGPFDSSIKSAQGLSVYMTRLASGENRVSYQFQLNNPGQFKIPQSRVESVYQPSVFGEVPNPLMTVVD